MKFKVFQRILVLTKAAVCDQDWSEKSIYWKVSLPLSFSVIEVDQKDDQTEASGDEAETFDESQESSVQMLNWTFFHWVQPNGRFDLGTTVIS